MSQGAKANKSGNVLEKTVEGTLLANGYLLVCSTLPKKQRLGYILHSTLVPKRYARQVYIGEGIYQTDLYVDFFIFGSDAIPSGLIIECKWQESTGSVDEKLPYLNLNIEKCYPAPTIVVIGGEGGRQGAVDWLKKQVQHNHNLLGVYSLDRFIAWANKKL